MKRYNIYLVGSGKKVGWTQDTPFGPVYNDEGECTGEIIAHNPGSQQLVLHPSGAKVNAMKDQHDV